MLIDHDIQMIRILGEEVSQSMEEQAMLNNRVKRTDYFSRSLTKQVGRRRSLKLSQNIMRLENNARKPSNTTNHIEGRKKRHNCSGAAHKDGVNK